MLLLKNIDYLATMDRHETELTNAYIVINNNVITKIGEGDPPLTNIDDIIDLQGYVVLPGFVNTHHHLFQSLFRNIRDVSSSKLFDWLTYLYEIWKYIDNDAIYTSSIIGIYEMMSTGVTTTTDMLYLHPKGKNGFIDTEINAAEHCGVRFHPTRGSMSLSKKDGGLPPDSVVQTEREILEDSERIINEYHDPDKFAMTRIALAPCSPFSVTEELMIKTRELAEEYGVLLHTHLAETKDEEEFCLESKALRPVDYMEKVGWLKPETWFAHLVWLSAEDIERLSKADCGFAHCPTSNMRLGSGIAPVTEMKKKNMKIGVAVDGSASNDSGNMIWEIRNALMLQRVVKGANALTPRDVLHMATIGGARVLGMDDYIGTLEEGKAADIIGFDTNKLSFAGGLSDPVASIVMCDPGKVDFEMINGTKKILNGNILDSDLNSYIAEQNRISKWLINL
ncbi:MAG: 8-oxoguanine deaminase [Kosmotogaceae bacterium]